MPALQNRYCTSDAYLCYLFTHCVWMHIFKNGPGCLLLRNQFQIKINLIIFRCFQLASRFSEFKKDFPYCVQYTHCASCQFEIQVLDFLLPCQEFPVFTFLSFRFFFHSQIKLFVCTHPNYYLSSSSFKTSALRPLQSNQINLKNLQLYFVLYTQVYYSFLYISSICLFFLV